VNERATRRLSQAISEGDGISVLVEVRDAAGARAAEAQGADGVVVDARVDGLRGATELPILWRAGSPPTDDDADGWALAVSSYGEWDEVAAHYERGRERGLECILEVRDEEELEEALEHVDPEIFLLAGSGDDPDADPLDHVLSLLPDVPAGKLAIAHVREATEGEVEALERAGIDAVVVSARDVSALVGAEPPEV
jgi:indole-3-glycerol phosphate synthase